MTEPDRNDSAAGLAGDDQSMRALAQQIIAGDGLSTSTTSSGLSPWATFGTTQATVRAPGLGKADRESRHPPLTLSRPL